MLTLPKPKSKITIQFTLAKDYFSSFSPPTSSEYPKCPSSLQRPSAHGGRKIYTVVLMDSSALLRQRGASKARETTTMTTEGTITLRLREGQDGLNLIFRIIYVRSVLFPAIES